MFKQLAKINQKPALYQFYTAPDMWNDPYISRQMLAFHLSDTTELASRNIRFIERSVDWICNYFQLDSNSRLVDFGCGPGLYTSRFARRGIQVTGVDFSENSISYATEQALEAGLNIDYRQQDYLEFKEPSSFDLITMIYCDYSALSSEQRASLLGIFSESLKDEGAILLDVYSLAQYAKMPEATEFGFRQMGDFWSDGDYYGFLNTFNYEGEKVVLNQHTIIEPQRTRTIYNWLKCYSFETLRKEFAEHGLQIESHFANVAGDPYAEEATEIAVIARKVR
ncbi:SAM-dependent methyltransferase [Dongshaea marina]|uniref:SAM-dependent methyltransferase n=1 Tax=Dongshaea marina TaxID=2047966 RepID=UPI000D3E0F37|nr:class I SAM-dependent methyltransferase [Dongshaea marina]